jgi:toxin FitB
VSYLLDTCLISELIKPKPDRKIVNWVKGIDDEDQYLSSLTIGEIQKGISKLNDSDWKRDLQQWLECDLLERFRGRIVSIDSRVAQKWGEIIAQAELRGTLMPIIDSLIAATGIVHDLTVVTRNTGDMEGCGVNLLNPWINDET